MVDDSEQLAYELTFSPRRTLTRREVRPPGAVAITAFSLIYVAVLWVPTLLLLAGVLGGRPGSAVIEPGSCVVLVVLGAEVVLAGWLASRTWVALGPSARAVLRPMMILGPWPLVLVLGFGLLLVASLVSGALRGKLFHQAPVAGTNWKLFQLSGAERAGVSYDAATVRCLELGDGWKVPSEAELAYFQPAFEGFGRTNFWLEARGGEPVQAWQECKGFDCTVRTSLAPTGAANQVVCFKP
ncbi:MAG: hypothetical protein IT380_15100 [Myxococcales bacterium]|nr:hypothetical protein [Myxococcales bacterium]